ncbi:MAG: hypothetical protein ACRDO9_03085 [Gaiellales bacterium]
MEVGVLAQAREAAPTPERETDDGSLLEGAAACNPRTLYRTRALRVMSPPCPVASTPEVLRWYGEFMPQADKDLYGFS